MMIRDVRKSGRFKAMDGTTICELLHPEREGMDLTYSLPYSLAHATLAPGEESLPHKLLESSEVYYILEGRGRMHIGGEAEDVFPDQAVYIPPGSWQWIRNTGDGDLKFLCVVYPYWRREDEICSEER